MEAVQGVGTEVTIDHLYARFIILLMQYLCNNFGLYYKQVGRPIQSKGVRDEKNAYTYHIPQHDRVDDRVRNENN